ncbi:MAG TPA: trypsin-like peptidase domain-containing protein [Mycobacterium sp.]
MRTWVATAAAVTLLTGSLVACGHAERPPEPSVATGPAPVPTAAAVAPDPRIGAIFLGGGDTHVCTASVLHSSTGDLVLTAEHCLADGIEADFVPAFQGEADSSAMWRVTAVYLDPRWVADEDPLADYAIVRVSRAGSAPIEAQVGSALSLGATPAPGSVVSVTGYPLGVGGGPVGCRGTIGVADGGYPSLLCGGLVDGTSGAPWISESTVTGVTGGFDGGGCDADVSYSAPFDDNTSRLLARAQAGGPGDAAPNTLMTDC